jgi:molybdate transport system substrate-binding protein
MHRRLFLAAATLVLAGCASPAPASSPSSALTGSITVLAASSLTSPFAVMARDFESAHAGTTVQVSFAGSSTLVAQVQQGAVADILASADQPTMQKLVDGDLVQGTPTVFARNRLQIVVRVGNPRHIRSLSDLARPGLVVVLCSPAVPCGRYAGEALQRTGVTITAASQETDVKAVISKVSLGEADAGIVYVTDVKAAGGSVEGVDIPDRDNVIASYPIVVLKDSTNVPLAKAFVAYVLNGVPDAKADGQRTLHEYGFLAP